MTTRQHSSQDHARADDGPLLPKPVLSKSDRVTLDALFRHPMAHNLGWTDIIALFEKIGSVEHKSKNDFAFKVGAERHLVHKPHAKDLTAPEVMDMRHFAARAGWSPQAMPQPDVHPAPEMPTLIVAVDHHGARIYRTDSHSNGNPGPVTVTYDAQHVLQPRERGQSAPEDPSFYPRIAKAIPAGGQIVIVGHGKGHSNAAHQLTEYLQAHHAGTHQRVVCEVVADLPSLTDPQILELGRRALAS